MAYVILPGANGHAIGQAAAGAATAAVDSTGADIAIGMISGGSAGATVGDNKGNTITMLTDESDGATVFCRMFFCQGLTTGAGHVFSSLSGILQTIAVILLSGSASSPTDGDVGANTGGLGSTTKSPGTIIPSQVGDIFVTGMGTNNSGSPAFTIDQSFIISDQLGLAGGVAYGGALAYFIDTGITTKNPTWTQGGANFLPTRMAAFKAAAAAGATVKQLAALGVG